MDNENFTWDKIVRSGVFDELVRIKRNRKSQFLVELIENKDGSYTLRSNHRIRLEPQPPPVDTIWEDIWIIESCI